MVTKLKYVYKDNCGLCEYFRPHFNKIVSENGWESEFLYANDHMDELMTLGVQITPTILIFVNDVYCDMIPGVVKRQTIEDTVKSCQASGT